MGLDLDVVVMRKVALRFLPLLGLCYTINVLDRFNVSVAQQLGGRLLDLGAGSRRDRWLAPIAASLRPAQAPVAQQA